MKRKRKQPPRYPLYVTMRRWDKTQGKVVTIKGHCLILRNYDPGRAFAIMVKAFRVDSGNTERADRKADTREGES